MEIKRKIGNCFFIALIANYLTLGLELKSIIAFVLFVIMLCGQNNSLNLFLGISLSIILGILLLLLLIQKIIVLPLAYRYIEKYAQETIILDFIHNLKSSWKWKVGVMAGITIIMVLLSKGELRFLVFLLLISPLPSYLALFLWWWIEDLIKKRKMQNFS